jgi:signal transduction histidine kinase
MMQALLNLLQNAVQAMPGGGTLSMSLHRVDARWHCAVRDTGVGIAPDVLAKIFNLYFTTKSGGSGIGLSIVHQIVSEHGGEISVQSVQGEGSSFEISLPVPDATPAPES